MTTDNFKPGTNYFHLYSHALATVLPGGACVKRAFVKIPDEIDISIRRGSLEKDFSYDSPFVPSVRNRRAKPQVQKVASVLDSVDPQMKVVALTAAPCDVERVQDWLSYEDAISWAKKIDVGLNKVTSICGGLLFTFFQVAISRDGFFPHLHFLVEIPVDVLPEQVAHELANYLGETVRVRSDEDERALMLSFFAAFNADDELAESGEEATPESSNIARARYYLRPGIELHSDLEDNVAGDLGIKDPRVRAVAGTPGRASMMATALAIVVMSHFGKCFRSFGRARKKLRKDNLTPAAAPISVGMCSQSSATNSPPTVANSAKHEKHAEEAAAAYREHVAVKKAAQQEAYLQRGWRIKGAYWSWEWIGGGKNPWIFWLHVIVKVLPGGSPPSFVDLYGEVVWPGRKPVNVGEVWRAELARGHGVAMAA